MSTINELSVVRAYDGFGSAYMSKPNRKAAYDVYHWLSGLRDAIQGPHRSGCMNFGQIVSDLSSSTPSNNHPLELHPGQTAAIAVLVANGINFPAYTAEGAKGSVSGVSFEAGVTQQQMSTINNLIDFYSKQAQTLTN